MRALDDHARAEFAALRRDMRFAVLAVVIDGFAHQSRIAVQWHDGAAVALLSGLARHSSALMRDPRCALFIAAPVAKGDPMTQPRANLHCLADAIGPVTPDWRARWLLAHPRAAAYIDLPDFQLWRLAPQSGFLNAGFGRAFDLGADDFAD